MTTDSYIRAQYLQLIRAGFLIFVLVLCHVTSKLAVSRSRPSVPYGAIFYNLEFSLTCMRSRTVVITYDRESSCSICMQNRNEAATHFLES